MRQLYLLIGLCFICSLSTHTYAKKKISSLGAREYCEKFEPANFKACQRKRAQYLTTRRKITRDFRTGKQNCEAFARNEAVTQNQVNVGNTRISAGRTTYRNSRSTYDRASEGVGSGRLLRGDKLMRFRKCMKELGWKKSNTASSELKALDKEFGYVTQ